MDGKVYAILIDDLMGIAETNYNTDCPKRIAVADSMLDKGGVKIVSLVQTMEVMITEDCAPPNHRIT